MQPVILPYDGKGDFNGLLDAFLGHFKDPLMGIMTGYVKLNDANFYPDATAINVHRYVRTLLKHYAPKCGIFLDLKLADTNGTVVNILKNFVDAGVAPDILTVRESIGAKGYLMLRRLLPNTKLALVSALTDIPEEEIRERYGMFPALKIINDLINIQAKYDEIKEDDDPEQLFDMVVCSPLELEMLINNFPVQYQYVVPGIRDAWMTKGQQARVMGVKEALDMGATYVVMGSQMTKGNPMKLISAEESRKLTFERIKKARYTFFSHTDPIKMLFHSDGYYESTKDDKGKYIGPLAGYAGKDAGGKNYVGFTYFNFAKAEENPLVLAAYAYLLAKKIKAEVGIPDVVLGMPMGGLLLASLVARFLGCRCAFAEKKVTKLPDPEKGTKEESELVIKRHDISSGDKVVVIEDVCNNFSTTEKADAAVRARRAKVIAIATAINRSEKNTWKRKPVSSVCHIPSGQYSQDDPEVARLIKEGKVVWKPKHDWDVLKMAMAA